MKELVTIIGPTACGKTTFAAHLAQTLAGEIISGDSRQLYRGMDIGTGKDLADYSINGNKIPYHLIDICNAGDKFTLFDYQKAFYQAYKEIVARNRIPILCGGTGLYIESVLKGYNLIDVPQNRDLRESLKTKSIEELSDILSSYKTQHNSTDLETRNRAIRAIEIADYQLKYAAQMRSCEAIDSIVIGIDIPREKRRERITQRLKARLKEGMIEEVENLIHSGVRAEDLIYYGLEYKFVTEYVIGKLSYEEMFIKLEIAIHQFSKRQMTWFRGMERRRITINWISYDLPLSEKIEAAKYLIQQRPAT